MKKILIIIFFLFASNGSRAQESKSYSVFILEAKRFIDTSRNNFSVFEGKHNVYYLKLFSDNKNTNDFCYMMTYVDCSYSYPDIDPKYAFNIGDDIVVLDLEHYSKNNWLPYSNYTHIDGSYRNKILNKLMLHEAINNKAPALLFCYKENGPSYKMFYKKVEDLPPQFQFLHQNRQQIEGAK